MAGAVLPVYALVPGVASFRVPARSLFLANLAGAVLAGLGIETMRTRMAGLIAWRRLAAGWRVVAVVVVGLLLFIQLRPVHRPSRRSAPAGRRKLAEDGDCPAQPALFRPDGLAAARVLGDGGFWFAMGGVWSWPSSDAGRSAIGDDGSSSA